MLNKKALLNRELNSGKRDLNPRHPGPKRHICIICYVLSLFTD